MQCPGAGTCDNCNCTRGSENLPLDFGVAEYPQIISDNPIESQSRSEAINVMFLSPEKKNTWGMAAISYSVHKCCKAISREICLVLRADCRTLWNSFAEEGNFHENDTPYITVRCSKRLQAGQRCVFQAARCSCIMLHPYLLKNSQIMSDPSKATFFLIKMRSNPTEFHQSLRQRPTSTRTCRI